MRPSIRAARLVAAAVVTGPLTLVLMLPGAALATPVVKTHVMVNLSSGADAVAVVAAAGLDPDVVFVEGGFATVVSPAELTKLQRSASVLSVAPDPVVAHLSANGPAQPAQVVRAAQRRIGLLSSVTANVDGRSDHPIDVDVAVFDGGIDRSHPDLNVAGGVDCAADHGYWDRDGHGTMVAGLIGAIDNKIGIVGVAPGARLWAVRIATPDGNILDSSLRCGLEWLNKHSDRIEVANFSFSEGDPMLGPCGIVNGLVMDELHNLTCRAVDAGVTIVAAAGNEASDAGTISPSAWPEVITASATAETDAIAGGLGPLPCLEGELDDHIATFSNFGQAVDIAAPGVCLTSTYPGGLYAFGSGTSYASPLVAGAAGLILSQDPSATPGTVRSALLAAAEPGPIPGDVDGFAEGLLNVAGL